MAFLGFFEGDVFPSERFLSSDEEVLLEEEDEEVGDPPKDIPKDPPKDPGKVSFRVAFGRGTLGLLRLPAPPMARASRSFIILHLRRLTMSPSRFGRILSLAQVRQYDGSTLFGRAADHTGKDGEGWA